MSSAGLARLNALSDDDLSRELERCCGSRRWLAEVMSRRPFGSVEALYAAAAAAWQVMDDDDCREAFDAVGEHDIASIDDQQEASRSTREAAAVALRLYRERFGYHFVTDSDSLAPDELLMLIRIRLGHDEGAELRRARAEHARLTHSRLEQLVNTPDVRA